MISVVICAYTMQRWTQLIAAVESVLVQSDPAELVVVIDHNDELFARAHREWPGLQVITNRFVQGLSGARNTGVHASHGEIVAFLDDDATAEHDWLVALRKPFDDPQVGAVGGFVVPAWVERPPRWLPPEFWWVVGCSYIGQPTVAAEIRNPIGANMAVRRTVFEQVGGFREEIGRVGNVPLGCEETELSIRARAAGWSVWYQPEAVVHHVVMPERATWRYFIRRCRAEGMSKAVVSSMSGREDGLSSERAYVASALPRGFVDGWHHALAGPHRLGGLGRMVAIVVGVAAAGWGFVTATARAFGRKRTLVAPPVIAPVQSLLEA